MEKELKQIELWKVLYSNENLDISFLSSSIQKLKSSTNFFNKPKASMFGIEFESDLLYGYSYLNYYSIVYLIKAFYDNFLAHKNASNVIIYFDSSISNNIVSKVISYLNLKKCNVFVFDHREITPNMIKTLNSQNIEISFLIFEKNIISQKYYLSIFMDNLALSIFSQQRLIDYFYNDLEFINFGLDDVPVYINLEKFLMLNSSQKLPVQLHHFFDYEQFKGVILTENSSDFKFLKTLFNSSKIKFKISHNSYLFNYYNSAKRHTFKALSLFDNFLNFEVIFLIGNNNKLKIFIKQKNKFIWLNQYQVAYLFIKNEVLKWRKQEKKQILVPLESPQLLIELIDSFNFEALKVISFKDTKEVIFGFNNDSYLCDYNNTFKFSNISMMLLLIEILVKYKQNNNLLNLKLLKMKEHFAKSWVTLKTLKINPEQIELLKGNFPTTDLFINKKFEITHLENLEYKFQNHQYLFLICSTNKKLHPDLFFQWIISYDTLSKNLTVHCEFNFHKPINWFRKLQLMYFNKKFIKKVKRTYK
ncbi:hypothetical protein NPA08_02765 [Mycoplasmopsis citelli]|uniref:MAG5620 family putative phospho-sugar mutase n=1 Tax=Mycoplasmopsis citelli TaxID=171281 RepID=UPI0021154DA8|nr:hypothetical protein [Mycoplasmopsis citelli]UUD35868.1 hypothetical protein NPA08_02765 [Mycoplasmopsis citelli]